MPADEERPGFLVPEWPAPSAVRARVTTRNLPGASLPPYQQCNLGLRSGDLPERVLANRSGLRNALDLPSAPHWLQQVHGHEVRRFTEPGDDPIAVESSAGMREPIGDAAVTDRAGVVLAVLSADCLPVLFCNDDGSVVAAAHAGWRGLAAGVLERSVQAMAIPPGQVLAWLGPAIAAQRYEVGSEVHAAFVDSDAGTAHCFAPTRPGHWQCDLYGLARRRLCSLGVERIHGGGHCTWSEGERFYSYRRDGAASGRQACLIWIDPASAGLR